MAGLRHCFTKIKWFIVGLPTTNGDFRYNVGPPRKLSLFITPITIVYATYNELVPGA